MNFVHDDTAFSVLLLQVSEATRVAPAMVEKDDWTTHALWSLHETDLDIWFKGGTSLSKGFGIIERFSEDLDLMIERGREAWLPEVGNWNSLHRSPVAQRQAFYRELSGALIIPGMPVVCDVTREDRYARGADYIGRYPGAFVADLPSVMSSSVRFEVGRARVVPFVERPISSFVHEHLARVGMLGDFIDNRPLAVRCVHPIVTLLEKLEALSRRYGREQFEPDGFVRHYEDAARIVLALDRLPSSSVAIRDLMAEMVSQKDITTPPNASDPSLLLDHPAKRELVQRAYTRIAPMFWGPRISLDAACGILRDWISEVASA